MIDIQKQQMVINEITIEGKVYKDVTILTEVVTTMFEVPGEYKTYVRSVESPKTRIIIPKLPKKEKTL